MKLISFILVLALPAMGLSSPQPLSAQSGKILLVAKDGASVDLELVLREEVGVMTTMLQEEGFDVVVASPSGQPMAAGETTLTPDLVLGDAVMTDYAGLIMPCMAMEEDPPNTDINRLVNEAVDLNKPIAAQLGSVVHLVRAGVMEGKKFAFVEEFLAETPELEGMDFAGQGVVDEGIILTGGVCPYAAGMLDLEDTTEALTEAFIGKLSG